MAAKRDIQERQRGKAASLRDLAGWQVRKSQ
jgi:hypothetical protein